MSVLKSWRRAGAVALVACTGLLVTGCVVAPVDGYGYTAYGDPPPPRYEVVPVAPAASYVWMPGVWVWGTGRYDWRPGYWAPPHGPRAGMRPAPRPRPGGGPRPHHR